MEMNIVVNNGGDDSDDPAIIPAFIKIMRILLDDPEIKPWMTMAILSNAVAGCVFKMNDEAQSAMMEYFFDSLKKSVEGNFDVNGIKEESGNRRPH